MSFLRHTSFGTRTSAALLLLGPLTAGSALTQTQTRAPDPMVIGVLAVAADSLAAGSFRRGVELGITEAERAAQLLQRSISVSAVTSRHSLRDAADSLEHRGARALVAWGRDSAAVDSLGRWATATGIPVLVVGPASMMSCHPFLFRIAAPARVSTASLLASSPKPGAQETNPRTDDAFVALWHPSLERFGASQLSDRFRERFGSTMDSNAWAGWMAVKAVWESSLRSPVAPDALRDAIARGSFDGHKGRPLRFGTDGYLRQPLVILRPARAAAASRDSLVAEVAWPDDAARSDSAAAGAGRSGACGEAGA
jgi:hypothetical protein